MLVFFFFFPFYLCLFFLSFLFWTNPVRRDLIATITAQEKKSLSSVKNVNHLTSPRRRIENLLLCTSRHFSESAQSSVVFIFFFPPLGHCRYIFLYSFRICSTVNYRLYVILEERRRAGARQQSHQSLWLHNSCHPYSNKIYHIVNHQDANVRRSAYVCARRSADNSEVIN